MNCCLECFQHVLPHGSTEAAEAHVRAHKTDSHNRDAGMCGP